VNKRIKIFEPKGRKNDKTDAMSWQKCSVKYSDRTGKLLTVCKRIFADIYSLSRKGIQVLQDMLKKGAHTQLNIAYRNLTYPSVIVL
jgi:hypothetical protein